MPQSESGVEAMCVKQSITALTIDETKIDKEINCLTIRVVRLIHKFCPNLLQGYKSNRISFPGRNKVEGTDLG